MLIGPEKTALLSVKQSFHLVANKKPQPTFVSYGFKSI
jgi:hypothetical protein